jgi:cell pole-organizing protein PopZ
LHFVDAPRRNKHIVFEPEQEEEDGLGVETAAPAKKARSALAAAEADGASPDGASESDDSAESPLAAAAEEKGLGAASQPLSTEVERARALAYKELALRLQRKKKLTGMVADIEQRRNLLVQFAARLVLLCLS